MRGRTVTVGWDERPAPFLNTSDAITDVIPNVSIRAEAGKEAEQSSRAVKMAAARKARRGSPTSERAIRSPFYFRGGPQFALEHGFKR